MGRILRVASLLAVVCALCPEVRAKEWREELNDHISHGRVARIDKLLTDERLAQSAESGNNWLNVTATLERYSPFLIQMDPKTFGKLIERVVAVANKRKAENPKNTYQAAAWACATAARCRALVGLGNKKAQPEWRAAADCMAALYDDRSANADLVSRAAAWLGEAAAVRAENDKELFARAKEILDKLAAREPNEEATQVALGRWYVARASAAVARKSKSAGKAAVKEGLAYLETHLARAKPAALVTVQTDLLLENEAGRFGVKAEMRTKTVNRPTDGVVFVIPDSKDWELIDTSKSPSGVAVQRMLGGLLRREYSIQSWKSDGTIYADRDQMISVGLSDTKKLATVMLGTLDQYANMDEVTKRHRPKKAKLHKDFTDVWHIRLEGMTKEGRWVMAHAYYFTPKKIKRTYSLLVREYQRESTPDAAAEYVLENLQLK